MADHHYEKMKLTEPYVQHKFSKKQVVFRSPCGAGSPATATGPGLISPPDFPARVNHFRSRMGYL